MDEENPNVFLSLIGSIITDLLTLMWEGFVLTCLWAWFVVPTFGVAPLTFITAMGLMLVVGLMCVVSTNSAILFERYKEDKGKLQAWSLILSTKAVCPAILLGFGYLIHLFQ